MKIVLCGGFGYIGCSFIDYLLLNKNFKKAEIIIIDNWSYGRGAAPYAHKLQKIKNVKILTHDISLKKINSYNNFKNHLKDCDYLINLASLTQVPDTILHYNYIYKGVKNIIDILKINKKIKKIIDISSTSIYGSVKLDKTLKSPTEPYNEEIFPNPKYSLHNYASSKLKAEKLWLNSRLPYLSLRLSTVYGFGPGLRYNQFINSFIIDSLLAKKIILPGDGDNFRPFIHINDLTEIFGKLLLSNVSSEILNVGSESQNLKLKDIFKIVSNEINKLTGIRCNYNFESKFQVPKINESYKISFDKFNKIINHKFKYNFKNATKHFLEFI